MAHLNKDKFIITNDNNDKYPKNKIQNDLLKYKWNDISAMLKNKGLIFNRFLRNQDDSRGAVLGIKRVD